ncbi:hypothetical protein [Roseburia sp. AF42-8]|uniref:hypothetical protein n=1 Tax=Roseburia sp. AF42-8 TaxID=2293137 RepID=UPI000E44ADAB|nr:hypothetical protein [Roseburia sp. AF42-8]RGF45279.1 hypothetical protein DW059_04640 [Roseburia sp. AF42-8]
MKKYKFTILLLLTFVIAFPVITVKLVTAEQEKKARQEELAQVTDTEKEPAEAVAGTEENSTDKAGTGQEDIDSTENTEDKTGTKDNETVQIRSRREPLQQRISAIFPMLYLLEIPEQ